MKKTITWALATMALLTVLTGCKKEDEDEIPSSDVNKGAYLVRADDGKDYYVVDLGYGFNGKKWATCNIGATNCKEYGNYFAWGDTAIRDNFDWSVYIHCNKSRLKIKKYSVDSENTDNNTADELIVLNAEDDIATKLLGSKWSIPTKEDYERLISRCDWRCGHVDGVWGYLFTSRDNGNSIFFPLAGKRDLKELLFAESYGFYWSKNLYEDKYGNQIREYHNDNASILKMTKPTNPIFSTYEERYIGLPIRPVYK